jgi:4-azaleucine resistance transporter AzlC
MTRNSEPFRAFWPRGSVVSWWYDEECLQMRELKFALKRTAPFLLSYLFIGIAFGIMMTEAGYAPVWSALSAVFIYAGSMQIVMVPLIAAGAPLYALALMALFINARHMFYGLGFVEKFRKMGGLKYPYMALTLTDEAYSALCALDCPEDLDEGRTSFLILAMCHLTWIFSCTLGAVSGDILPIDLSGIDFAATAFFTTVVVDQWRKADSHVPAIVGGFGALLFLFDNVDYGIEILLCYITLYDFKTVFHASSLEIHIVQCVLYFFHLVIRKCYTFSHAFVVRRPFSQVEFRFPVVPADHVELFGPALR